MTYWEARKRIVKASREDAEERRNVRRAFGGAHSRLPCSVAFTFPVRYSLCENKLVDECIVAEFLNFRTFGSRHTADESTSVYFNAADSLNPRLEEVAEQLRIVEDCVGDICACRSPDEGVRRALPIPMMLAAWPVGNVSVKRFL